jgi:glycosyltransferase involved in cell wall biosynthesis
VITVHDLAFLRYPQLLTGEARRYYGLIGKAVESAQAIIAVSQSTARDLTQLLGTPPDKVHVVYEAASPLFHPLTAEERADLAIPQKVQALPSPFLLFVGTLEPRKNLPALLRALAQLKGEMRDRLPHLVVVGGLGWLYQESLDLIGQLGLEDKVVLFGPASTQELLWLYNSAELFVLPSLYEGFGLTAVEALACGLPAVLSRCSSLPEVAGEAALFFDPQDPQALASAIKQGLEDQELRTSLRQKGPHQAARFSWAKAAQETLAVYRQAVER